MKQTAIQQAIEMVRTRIEKISLYDNMISKHNIHHLQQVERELYELLKAEKEQIKDAYEEGYSDGYRNLDKWEEQYYNETYGEK
jgi:hypothetical protein